MFSVVRMHHCCTYQGLKARAKYNLAFAQVAGLNPDLQSAWLRNCFVRMYVLSESVFQSTNCYSLLVSSKEGLLIWTKERLVLHSS